MHHSQLNYKERDGVIIGCSSLAQLESNLKDFEKGPLPSDVITALDVSLLLSVLIIGSMDGSETVYHKLLACAKTFGRQKVTGQM
jgi:hypothetical protein